MIEPNLLDRIQQHARAWRVTIENTLETKSSVIAFGTRDMHGACRKQDVALKVVKQPGDEWHSGEVLAAFYGKGFVRVFEHAPGAMLLERLRPGNSLVELSLNGRDEQATDILADVIQQMSSAEFSTSERESRNPPAALQHCPTVHDWAKAFDRYVSTADEQIPMDLVTAGQRVYLDLRLSQQRQILLHGDLQHSNVLFDSDRGWLAIDPKGVFGEIEYEIGAVLRNPVERPELFLSHSTIERRLGQFTSRLNLNYERTLAWGFAQALLSAIWGVEDGFTVDATNPALRLAAVMRPMLRPD